MHRLILHLFLLLVYRGTAQTQLNFEPVMGAERIRLNEKIEDEGNWIEISALRFYISDMKVYSGRTSWQYPVRYLLIDLEQPSSLILKDLPQKIDSLTFTIGVDSTTNVSGILDGALDPINGMYWAWNSGYINFKLEGKTSLSINTKKDFEFHLGGYLPPFQTVQNKTIIPNPNSDLIIQIDLRPFISSIDWSREPNIMIPGEQAKLLSEVLPHMFKLKL